jgi:tetratricopeptide (TPR) repeat protein
MTLPPGTRSSTPLPAGAARLLQEAQSRLQRGDFPAAADIAQSLLRQDGRMPEAWVLLCAALIRMGSADDDRALADALASIPVTHPAHAMLAAERSRVLARRGRYNEGVELARMLEAHIRLTPRQHDLLSNTYTTAGLFEDGLSHAEKAAAALPKDPSATYNRALALRYLGRIEEAVDAFERVIAIAPDFSLAYFGLADCRRWTSQHNHIAAMEAALQAPNLHHDDAARFNYALYKEYNDTGDLDRAWKALTEGARIASSHAPYNLAERTAYTDALITRFTGNLGAPRTDLPEPVPIFIIGLPRSGTTLVERIFSAHPDVTDMGETHGFSLAIRDAGRLKRFGELDLESLTFLDQIDWQQVGQLYLKSLEYRKPETRFFTEKLPHNYHLAGPMRLAFPQARIVHLRRAPMDSLFGAYKVLFGEGSYLWSYRFEDLAAAYRLYRKITDHWRRELGENFIEVTLENLIADPETEIRTLLDRTGLSFHPECLSPHEVKGGVSTASSTQVRQPINSQGVGAWRRYAEGFEPLRQLLEADGFVDSKGDPVW